MFAPRTLWRKPAFEILIPKSERRDHSLAVNEALQGFCVPGGWKSWLQRHRRPSAHWDRDGSGRGVYPQAPATLPSGESPDRPPGRGKDHDRYAHPACPATGADLPGRQPDHLRTRRPTRPSTTRSLTPKPTPPLSCTLSLSLTAALKAAPFLLSEMPSWP